MGFTGSEIVLWLPGKTFHKNPLVLYDEKPVLVHLPIVTQFGPLTPWYGEPWVQNLVFNGSECILWLLDKTFHSNPISLYDDIPVLVHLPILSQFGLFTPWYGGPGYQILG